MPQPAEPDHSLGLDFLEDIIRFRYREMGCHTYRVNSLMGSMISTADPENIQAILATKFVDWDLGPTRKEMFYEVLGNGIFTAEREEWGHYRSQLKPQFTRDQVSDLEGADRHLELLFKALPAEDEKGWVEATDLLPFLYRFTLDVSTEFLFGQSVNSQSATLHSQDSGNTRDADLQANIDFADAMTYTQEFISWRMRLSRFAILMSDKKFKQACKTVKDFADKFVHIALDPDFKTPVYREGEKGKYVLLHELTKEVRDPIELRDQVLHILLAGRDTTSALLGWSLALLSRHPETFSHLRRTVIEHFGTEANPTAELTFSSLKACKELTHVLYETLRLYPLVPLNGRTAMKDTILPTGGGPSRKMPIVVKKGMQVGYPSYVLHRRQDIWGSDADNFRPGRWEGRKLGWEFIGFSAGPRVCLGREYFPLFLGKIGANMAKTEQYALNEASFVLVKFLQRYDRIEAEDMVSPIKKALTVILAPGEGGVKVKMHRASD
jgi:cytochrome P450